MRDSLEQELQSLLKLLGEMTALHEAWLPLCVEKRKALAAANADRLNEICRLENEKLQAVGEMEKRRLNLVASLTRRLDPGAKTPMKMVDLAEALPEPQRGNLLIARQQLRERISEVKTQSSIARRATESLMKHMGSLVHSVASAATGGSTYTHRGGTHPTAMTLSTMNMTA